MATDLFPVCSPQLLEHGAPLREPTDLENHVLLRLLHDEWPRWLSHAGLSEATLREAEAWRPGPRYADAGLMIQAALAGQGVALGQRVLVADDLAAGRLVQPFAPTLPSESRYWLVMRPGSRDATKVRDFRAWLETAVGGMAAME